MADDYMNEHPINLDFDFAHTEPYRHYPATYPTWNETLWLTSNWPSEGQFAELEFTGWRDEGIAKHETATVANYLSPAMPVITVSGPDAMKFFEDHLVNSFKKFPIGSAKHAIMCNDKGEMIMQGILYRLGEEEFETQCLMTLPYFLERDGGPYDLTYEDVTSERFMMQMSGKYALAIIEELCGENLHDLRYCHLTNVTIDGRPIRIYRFGMTGSIGYEVSGNVEDANHIYQRILEVGNKYGIRRMGARSYIMNHTPGGFLQYGCHYLNAIMDDEEYQETMNKLMGEENGGINGFAQPLAGSYDGPYQALFANPVEWGCGNVVKFDHEFPGRAVLEEKAAHPTKQMVTLDWNPEDLADIYLSQFRDEEPYQPMDLPCDKFALGEMCLNADKVLNDEGELIGISTHRTQDAYYRKMLSLCAIDIDYAQIGTEVHIVWGEPGTRQKLVRATVARYPYNTHLSNRGLDMETIPYGEGIEH